MYSRTIVISEDINTYAWVIKMMMEMEPRWSISNIRLMFADNFITPQLLTKLIMNDTFPLRFDHYHIINKVWPSVSSFG